ncbi:heterokaryon incompatibility protein-domain-containing protein [Paraphoma chrysanthemicola]|uniref:Heterokaryon incompatibility protein-domain-containing protein n=1 Tax=Paraphoma chrysanthemicola TaxID=798071 RepID=A0A8K0QZQ8_9PLEO|nr:heterokaryon incompatibility protein-domain-containing protein [Paraphoma chrysanthemicola]
MPDASNREQTLTQDFYHAPLDLHQSSLRLIEVLPSDSESPDRLIECVERHSTTSATYTCLSYVWGLSSGGDLRAILINGQSFFVRQNLWDFLDIVSRRSARDRNFGIQETGERKTNLVDMSRCLWIDALSINQENVVERNHQVKQMGAIYSNAERVIAWFGKGKSLRDGLQRAKDTKPDGLNTRFLLDLLAAHEYWERAWITQEITLAKELFFLATDEAVDHKTILDVGRPFLTDPRPHQSRRKPLYDLMERSNHGTLIENLARFRSKKCLDPRDRVFSLLGISSDGDRFPVDYDMSVLELCHILCASLESLCICTADSVRVIFESLDIACDRGKTSLDDPILILHVDRSSTGIHDKCELCGSYIHTATFGQQYDLETCLFYCLKCGHDSNPPDFHIVLAQELGDSDQPRSFHLVLLRNDGRVQDHDSELTFWMDDQGNPTFEFSLSLYLFIAEEGLSHERFHVQKQEHSYPQWQLLPPGQSRSKTTCPIN